jgi:hypothetical protein
MEKKATPNEVFEQMMGAGGGQAFLTKDGKIYLFTITEITGMVDRPKDNHETA